RHRRVPQPRADRRSLPRPRAETSAAPRPRGARPGCGRARPDDPSRSSGRRRRPRAGRRPDRSGRPSEVGRGPITAQVVDHGGRVTGRIVDARPDPEALPDPLVDLVGEVRVVAQEVAGVLLALTELIALVRVPGTCLADEARLDTQVDQAALTADALAVHDVELGLLEGRCDLVLDDLDPGAVADHLGAVL